MFFWSPHALPQISVSAFFNFLFFLYETMSNYSQDCWIDWNSAVLCFKRLFHIGVWTFARFVRPLLAHHTLYMGNLVPAYTMYRYHIFPCWQKKRLKRKNQARHRTDFESNRWPETGNFFGANQSLHQWFDLVVYLPTETLKAILTWKPRRIAILPSPTRTSQGLQRS